MSMEPLRVEAELYHRVVLPKVGYIHLDALLMWAAWRLSGDPPALDETQIREYPVPVQRSECGRYYLASASVQDVRARERRYVNKRFDVEHWQMLGGGKSANRIQTSAGPSKSFRYPVEAHHLDGHTMTWWCIGDRAEVERMLGYVTHLGRLRGHGEGEVRAWSVDPCESWGDGFPVVDVDGRPMRHLPEDAPGLVDYMPSTGRTLPPYHVRSMEGPIAAPIVEA